MPRYSGRAPGLSRILVKPTLLNLERELRRVTRGINSILKRKRLEIKSLEIELIGSNNIKYPRYNNKLVNTIRDLILLVIVLEETTRT